MDLHLGRDLQRPHGRIQVTPGSTFYLGTMFMGVDLAARLDASLEGQTTEGIERGRSSF